MKKIFTVAAALFSVCTSFSQEFDFNHNSEWLEKPVKHTVPAIFDSASAVGILDDRKIEYRADGDNIFVYYTVHDIIKINNDKGIEMYNKIYISLYADAQITDVKARTILKDGSIINMDASKIKEIEEEGRTYKLFAMEGVEKDAEVEYSYIMKRSFAVFSSEVYQDQSTPYINEFFTLITPEYLKFTVKGYNGFKVSADSVMDKKRIVAGYDTMVNELDDEKYAMRDQYLKRVDYKLSYNLNTSASVRLYTWKDFAKKAFAYYTDRSDKEEKALAGLAKQIKLPESGGDPEKILAIEDYIKTNINIDKKLISDKADAIEKIIKNKAANDDGIVKLFAGIFDEFNINYQIVFASNREQYPIDEDLENWNRMDDIIFYFNDAGGYIAPSDVELRYPYVPYNLAATRGLFLKGTVIGTFKTAIGAFGDINMVPFANHAENMEADVRFDETLDTLLISSKQILLGYPATDYRPVYVFLPKDKQDDVTKTIIKAVANSENISNIKIENTKLTDCYENKPLIISADIKSTDLLENAGSKILLKIGEIIGPQVEMYQEKPRQMPVELPFWHVLNRKVTLHLPDGYSPKNLKDINFDVTEKEGDEVIAGFLSSYTQTGSDITITISETYKRLKYPIAQFEEFKKVINASADFNKVVLVLEKKN